MMFETSVRSLEAARQSMTPIDALHEIRNNPSLRVAYDVQEAFSAGYSKQIGYKVGAASKPSQAVVGASEPFYGRLFQADTHKSGAVLSRRTFFEPGMEGEFSFRFGTVLPASKAPFSLDDIRAAIDAVIPSIEICDVRFRDWKTVTLEEIVADNAFHGALVLGDPITDWRGFDLKTHEIALSFDGRTVGRGPGSLILDDPLNSVLWVARRLAEHGISIKVGEIVAAGTCTGLHYSSNVSDVYADLGALGEVRFRLD